ncbi:MAG: hypothetical protein HOO91_11665 [Bacteroidales bacterium]|nr:hypothetical protein [Bacteroidales bacterium]
MSITKILKIIGSVGNQKSKESPGIILYNGIESGAKKTSKKKSCLNEKKRRVIKINKTGRIFNKKILLDVRNAFKRINRVETPIMPIVYFR